MNEILLFESVQKYKANCRYIAESFMFDIVASFVRGLAQRFLYFEISSSFLSCRFFEYLLLALPQTTNVTKSYIDCFWSLCGKKGKPVNILLLGNQMMRRGNALIGYEYALIR